MQKRALQQNDGTSSFVTDEQLSILMDEGCQEYSISSQDLLVMFWDMPAREIQSLILVTKLRVELDCLKCAATTLPCCNLRTLMNNLVPFCKTNFFQVLCCLLDCYPQLYCSFNVLTLKNTGGSAHWNVQPVVRLITSSTIWKSI